MDGSRSPVECWLEGSQPWIPKYEVFLPQVGNKESHFLVNVFSADIQIEVMSNTPGFILCIIDIEYLAGVAGVVESLYP